MIFCSDGIPEADNPSGEQFSYERTEEIIRTACAEGLSSDAIIDRLLENVDQFRGTTPRSDYMTCVVIKIEPSA